MRGTGRIRLDATWTALSSNLISQIAVGVRVVIVILYPIEDLSCYFTDLPRIGSWEVGEVA